MSQQSILLTYGTPAFVTPPQEVSSWRRVGIIFQPLTNASELGIDDRLFFEVIHRLSRLFHYDELVVCTDDKYRTVSLDTIIGSYFDLFDDDRDYPDRLEFRYGHALVCLMEIEKWAMVGGPAPYHDSYTIALYTPEQLESKVARCVRDAAREVGATVVDHLSV